ncbi:LPS export ABC transporter periplasmic protein LptC [bacterium]|nr:LPS export ABC transporter periplasmic protein LptC [candidate division CSSED10-310 bacterium]
MTASKNLLIGVVIATGFILLILMTYLIPMLFINYSDRSDQPDQDSTAAQLQTPDHKDTPGPVLVIKPFQTFHTSDGQRELEIRAVEAIIDQSAKLFQLNEIEEIVFFGKEGNTVRVKADKGSWNQTTNRIALTGDIRATIESNEREPVLVTCQWLDYDNDLGNLTGGSLVEIKHTSYSAIGEKLIIKPKLHHIQLENSVVAHIQPDAFKEHGSLKLDDAAVIECGLMLYNGSADVLQFDYSPRVSSGRNLMTCGRISVFMDGGNTRIIWSEHCDFKLYPSDGDDAPVDIKAEMVAVDRNAGSIILQDTVSIQRNDSLMRADKQVMITLDPKSNEVLGGSARGGVSFRDRDYSGQADSVSWDAGNAVVVMSGHASLNNNRDTMMEGDQIQLHLQKQFYIATGHVGLQLGAHRNSVDSDTTEGGLLQQFTNRSRNTDEPLLARAATMEIDELTGQMTLDGNVQGSQGSSRFAADKLVIGFDTRTREILDLRADGNVALSDQDRLMTGGKLHYSSITGDFEMLDSPVMWSGNSQLRAERFMYNEVEKILKMNGQVEGVALVETDEEASVSSAFGPEVLEPDRTLGPDRSSPNPSGLIDRYLHLTAGNGTYNETTGDLQFQDKVVMRKNQWTINSESLQVKLDPSSGRMISADAFGDVHVIHPLFDAKGHSLTYQPETSILILRGSGTRKCLVTQGERGSQGDEVRFFIQENRFEIDKGISMIMPSEISGTMQ